MSGPMLLVPTHKHSLLLVKALNRSRFHLTEVISSGQGLNEAAGSSGGAGSGLRSG